MGDYNEGCQSVPEPVPHPPPSAREVQDAFRRFLSHIASNWRTCKIPCIKEIRFALRQTNGEVYGLKEAKELFEATIGPVLNKHLGTDVPALKARIEKLEEHVRAVDQRNMELHSELDEAQDAATEAYDARDESAVQLSQVQKDLAIAKDCLKAVGVSAAMMERLFPEKREDED